MVEPSEDNLLTLDQLAEKLPEPTPQAIAAIESAKSHDAFVAVGTQIGSERISADQRRIYGRAYEWWTGASAAQRRKVKGFSALMLAVAIRLAIRLRDMDKAVSSGVAAGANTRKVLSATARQAIEKGIALRDQAFAALKGVAGDDARLSGQVSSAVGTAEDAEKPADGLCNVARVMRSFVSSTVVNVRTRAELANLDEQYASELEPPTKRCSRTSPARLSDG